MVTLQYLKPYFQNKKVFLTGHTGFKGTWLLQILKKLDAEVCGFALAPTHDYDLFHQVHGNNLCVKSIIHTIQDAAKVKEAILDFQPDYIFHLAAQPLVIESYQNPIYTFDTNVMGTAHILDALKSPDKKCICVNITTDKVYENPETNIPFLEDDKLGGYDPYSASKAAAEIIINSYRQSFFNPAKFDDHQKSIASVRAGNVIGGGDFADNRIVPDIVHALQKSDVLEVRNPKAIRPWQHVLEPLGGYLLLATKMWDNPIQFAQAYNFGPLTEDVLSVQELVEIAIATFGQGKWRDTSTPSQLHEATNLRLDIAKAKEQLQWQPKMSAKESVVKTIQWYIDARDAATKCNEQINQYFS